MYKSIFCLMVGWGTCFTVHAEEQQFTAWQETTSQDWSFNDIRSDGFEGKIESLPDGSVRIFDNQGGRELGAELRGDITFSPKGDCYRIEFDLAFLSLGAMDDSTAQFSTAHIYFCFQGVGLDLYVAADRLLFDPQWSQYQMLRSSTEHQRLTFLVDTKHKLIRMFVNGRTLGLYRAYDLPEEAIRITARGSTALAADLNVRKVTLEDASWDNPPHQSKVSYQPRPLHPAEWPASLRDPENTSHSPLKGNSSSLEVFQSIPVSGGSLEDVITTDLDGDGTKEIVAQFGGRIHAYDLTGSLLWQSKRSGQIVGLHDLDGDGQDEIVLNPFVALDGRTGADKIVVAAQSDDEPMFMGCWQFVELPIDLYPQAEVGSSQIAQSSPGNCLCAIFFLVGSDVGYVYRFPEGQKSGRREVEFRIAAAATNFNPTLAIANIDSEGLPEIVCITYDRAYAFDLRDGRPRMFHFWNSGRCYAELVTKNIDSDRHPELIVHACSLREHLSVLDNDGLNLSFGWQHFYEQNYPHNKKEYTTCLDSVNDFDGDGEMEILQSLYNDTGDERWHTLLVDAITGRVESDLPDRRAEAVIMKNSDEVSAVLITRALDRQLTEGLEAVWFGDEGKSQAVSSSGGLVKDTTRRGYPKDTAFSISCMISSRALLPSSHEFEQFYVQDNKAVLQFSLPSNADEPLTRETLLQLPAGYTLRILDDVDGDGKLDAILHSFGANRLQVVSGASNETLIGIHTGGSHALAVAARMNEQDEQLTLLLVDGQANLQAWTSCATNPQLQWEQQVTPRRSPGGMPPVSILDVEGDGNREILVGRAENRLALLDGQGKLLREWQLNGELHDWAFGNFTGDKLTDVVAMTRAQSGGLETCLFDASEDGNKPRWSRDVATYYGYPAVVDANGDGIEDIAFRYYFMRHILDGRNGLDLYPVTWVQGQHCTSVVYPDGRGSEPKLLMSGGLLTFRLENLDGTEIWSAPFSDDYCPATVGDFDGDGKLDAAGQTVGDRYSLNPFRSLKESWDKHVCIWDLASGEEKGRLALDGVCQGGLVSADLDGDGRDEIIAGTNQRELVVLGIENGSLQVESSLAFQASVGHPAIVDLQLDGQPEVLVSVEDGNFYLLRCRDTIHTSRRND